MILMNSSFSHFVFFLFLLSLRVAAESDLKFGGIFASNMVLQQQVKAPIWGTAEPGEAVALKCSWRGGTVRVRLVMMESGEQSWRLLRPAVLTKYRLKERAVKLRLIMC